MRHIIMHLFSLGLVMTICGNAFSQMSFDTTRTKNRKNIIRWNLTPMALVGTQSFVLGYERLINSHQSVSINIGQLKLRKILNLNLSRYGINTEHRSQGYSLAIDYRRYFKKRNRGLAPDGLYWGPFFTYYYYNWELGFNYVVPETQVNLNAVVGAEVNVYQLGLELGYQFVLFKRLTIDLVMLGPSFGRYSARVYAQTNVDTDEIDDIYKDMFEAIREQYPGIGTIMNYQNLEARGNIEKNALSMRYVLQLGFLF